METINCQTKISALIKANPLVIDELASLNPHFKKLKNVVLRNLLAPRVNIAEACSIAGCSTADFFRRMEEIGFKIADESYIAEEKADTETGGLPSNIEIVELDVRPALAEHQDPLKNILQAINKIKPEQALKIINTFEPVPLINLLSKKGYGFNVQRISAEEVHTYFYRTENQSAQDNKLIVPETNEDTDTFAQKLQEYEADKLYTIDVRGLPMPQPMLTILETLKKVGNNEALFVYHKKVPAFLLPELQERGFSYLFQHTDEGSVNMLIFK